MSITAVVENDIIRLPPGVHLPDGTTVEIQPVQPSAVGETPTLHDVFRDFIGKAQGLPADFAAEHDHYIHGTPKRSGE